MSGPSPARSAAIIIASTRAASGVYPDRTGPLIRDWLTARSFEVGPPVVVPDGAAVGAALRAATGLLTAGSAQLIDPPNPDVEPRVETGLAAGDTAPPSTTGLNTGGAAATGLPTGGSQSSAARDGAGDPLLAAASAVDLVITSGGTGISPTDRTPQATAEILEYEIPGLAAAIRSEGSDKVPTAVLSRGLVGVSGRTLIVNLPGSSGGVKDGLTVLDRVLDHALDQLRGGDHRDGGGA